MVGKAILGDTFQREFGAPYWNVHVSLTHPSSGSRILMILLIQRADLLQMLYDAAKPFLNVVHDRVISVSSLPDGSPSITTETGLVIHADLIIGADGIKSVVRPFVTSQKDRAKPVGYLAYRVVVPTDALLCDPLLRPLVEDPRVMVWMGPDRHIVGYCVVCSFDISCSFSLMLISLEREKIVQSRFDTSRY